MFDKNDSQVLEKTETGTKSHQALVIDDYFLIRHNFRLLFEKLKIGVHEAGNGEEAMNLLADYGPENFSIIIVDLVMPIMNGADFIIKAKERFGKRLPHILVCSSAYEKPLVKKIISLGISGYVVKPIDFKALISKIHELVPGLQ